jgi:hypothetical protein
VLVAPESAVSTPFEGLFNDWALVQMEKEGIEQGEDALHIDRVLACMATLVRWGEI